VGEMWHPSFSGRYHSRIRGLLSHSIAWASSKPASTNFPHALRSTGPKRVEAVPCTIAPPCSCRPFPRANQPRQCRIATPICCDAIETNYRPFGIESHNSIGRFNWRGRPCLPRLRIQATRRQRTR
jgi:hypothetical protein